MGWQLFPTGIGWRSFDRKVEHGSFACPNGRCSVEGRQPYVLKSGRNWITVLFVPIIPLNSTGSYVRCKRCKSYLPISVLTAERDRPEVPEPDASRPPEVGAGASPVAGCPVEEASSEQLRYRLMTDWAGAVVLEPGCTAVIGRDPDPSPTDEGVAVVAVPSAWLDVSKTHLAVHADGGVVLVEDRHSTNGTRVHPLGGREVALMAGDRVPATDETTILFGDHAMSVSITRSGDPDPGPRSSGSREE